MELRFHHVGVIVSSIKKSLDHYKLMFSENKISKEFHIASQGVKVCFIETGNNVFLELIEPVDEGGSVAHLIEKKIKYYHAGYVVSNMDQTIDYLCSKDFKHLETFSSEAFDGKRCAFLYTPELHLIELIEKK